MHLRIQDETQKPTTEEATAECKFSCKHCGNSYATKRGLRIHNGKCKCRNVHEAEKILTHRLGNGNDNCGCNGDGGYSNGNNGSNGNDNKPIGYGKTSFLIRWKGYSSSHDQ